MKTSAKNEEKKEGGRRKEGNIKQRTQPRRKHGQEKVLITTSYCTATNET